MRKIHKLTNPEHVNKEFKLKDFGKYTHSSQGITVGATGFCETKTYEPSEVVNLADMSVKKFYYVKNSYYAYLTDGTLVNYYGKTWRDVMYSSVEPYVIPFRRNNDLVVLAVGDYARMQTLFGFSNLDGIPYGSSAVIYKDMLFVAKDYAIYFSKVFDYQNFSDGLDNSGYVCADKLYGKVLSLIPRKNELIVVCEGAIYHLITADERQDYKLVKQDVLIKAQKGSVQDVGDAVYLFNGQSFCKYKNGTLSKVDCKIGEGYSFDLQSGVDTNTYYAQLTDGLGNKYLFTYNGITGETRLVETQPLLIANGGYFIEGNSIKRLIERDGLSGELTWQSKRLDFDTSRVKSLVGLEIKTSAPLELELDYSYGKLTRRVDSGLTFIKTHVIGDEFNIKLNFESANVNVEYVKFIYRTQED